MASKNSPLLTPGERVIMISGANRGIGLAIARQLHADGYRLSLGARRPEALAAAVSDITDERTFQHHFDALDAGSAASWVDATTRHYGRLDGLVNNAGVLHLHALDDYDEARFDEAWEVNVKAPYRLTAAALPHLRRSGVGRVVNINSRSGLRYVAGSADYCISKFANLALTHAARIEGWDDGVRSTAICPGPTETDMAGHVDPDQDLTQPETIAAIASLVLSLPNNASVPIIPVCCDTEAGV